MRRRVRGVLDVALEPYFHRIESSLRHTVLHGTESPDDAAAVLTTTPTVPNEDLSPPTPSDVPSDWFHVVNHELRSIELARLRGTARRAISVGASGRWYFDWFEQHVGPLELHVGVEAFEPEPDDLPDNAQWIPSTADRFDGLGNAEFDLVYAGQTVEHLWADELVGFLLEARRVLRGDGRLVIDCPNRLVTERLAWSHGGHTVELSASEIGELLVLAGFSIESTRGIWRCGFENGEILQLEDGIDQPAVLTRRIAEGADHPDDSFIWWVVARPSGASDATKLRERAMTLYADNWPTRISRGMWDGPPQTSVMVPVGEDTDVCSLPFYLRPGRIRLTVELTDGDWSSIESWSAELIDASGATFIELDPSDAEFVDGAVIWTLAIPHLIFAVSLVLHVPSPAAPVQIRMPIGIAEL